MKKRLSVLFNRRSQMLSYCRPYGHIFINRFRCISKEPLSLKLLYFEQMLSTRKRNVNEASRSKSQTYFNVRDS